MSRLILCGLGVFACLLALVARRVVESSSSSIHLEAKASPPPAAPLCPWRDPAADLKRFFPNADHYETETRILSALRLELQQRLGRPPTADENALHLYRIRSGQTLLGSVLTRRVKGTHGAIELVLAVDTNGQVKGLGLQRLREPDSIRSALDKPEWLGALVGERLDSPWRLGQDVPDVPAEARPSAQAIVDGARSTLILLAVADQGPSAAVLAARHH